MRAVLLGEAGVDDVIRHAGGTKATIIIIPA